MKNSLFAAFMLVALCAGAQQSSQSKSNEQPAQPQSAAPKTEPQVSTAEQPQAGKNQQPSNNNPPLTAFQRRPETELS